ncbi:MAG: riboflavin synthase [Methyloceanibacter sp.]
MFTGIVSDIGTLSSREGPRLRIAATHVLPGLTEGASVACDGCCLTVVHLTDGATAPAAFEVETSNETLDCTTLGTWEPGRRINLERALCFGAQLGGHLVTGHIDGLARIVSSERDGDSIRIVLESPREFVPFIATKGSVALDGVSLTVNAVDGLRFGVNIIPYTLAHTTWQDRKAGDLVNLEVDLLARYVERIALREADRP